MIIAEIQSTQSNDLFLVRFSEPNEKLTGEFLPVHGKSEIYRRLYFKNRRYMIDTLCKWLNQRAHVSPDYLIKATGLKLELLALENAPFSALCKMIERKAERIKGIAPKRASRLYNYYSTNIIPILEFCIGLEDNNKNGSSI